jgi:uncharacterized protein YdeI (YjbR/CyaY-like superfamily)
VAEEGSHVQVGNQLVVETRAVWHAWLAAHHGNAADIWLVGVRRSARTPSLSGAAACDEALCFGWTAGPSEMLDDDADATRFAPRALSAAWSHGDLDRARRPAREGRLLPAGIAVLARAFSHEFGLGPGRGR